MVGNDPITFSLCDTPLPRRDPTMEAPSSPSSYDVGAFFIVPAYGR